MNGRLCTLERVKVYVVRMLKSRRSTSEKNAEESV